jgi:hypothetical protein
VLPVEGRTVFRWELQKFLRGSIWVFVDVLLGCAVLAFLHDFSFAKWLAILPVAAVAWLLALSLTGLLVTRWPQLPYPLISMGLWILVIALLVTRSLVEAPLIALLNQCAPWILLILPTGWPVSLLEPLFDSRHLLNLSLLVPIALVIVTFRFSLARLRSNYDFAETTLPEPPDLMPDAEPESSPGEASTSFPRRAGPTEIEEIVRSRQFLAQPRWHERGLFERLLWRWLNVRERNLIELAFPEGPVLTKPWLGITRTLLIGTIATLIAVRFSPGLKAWLLGGTLFITGCRALALLLGVGVGFRPVPCGGVNIPFHAGFPVGFRELTRLLLKYSVVQLPAMILLAGIGGALVASILAETRWTTGMVMGIKVAFLLFALRYAAAIFSVSAVTNDTSGFRMKTFVLIFGMVGAGGAFLTLAGAGLAIPHAGLAWLSVLLACLVCFAAFRFYVWLYDANRFDLMNVPRQ